VTPRNPTPGQGQRPEGQGQGQRQGLGPRGAGNPATPPPPQLANYPQPSATDHLTTFKGGLPANWVDLAPHGKEYCRNHHFRNNWKGGGGCSRSHNFPARTPAGGPCDGNNRFNDPSCPPPLGTAPQACPDGPDHRRESGTRT